MTTDFTAANLPYGVVRRRGEAPRIASRLGDGVVFLGDVIADRAFEQSSLNAFLAQGPDAWASTRAALRAHLATQPPLTPIADVEPMLPVEIGDYVDFYSSLQHATNLGRLFRPDGEPLLPNWRHLPVAYHGRAGSVVVSGTPVRRPAGLVCNGEGVVRQPTAALDLELEVGFIVGTGNAGGAPIAVDEAGHHVFGAVLVNDWSARDIQAFEYQPLGPFLGKSFLTTVSPWVVPLDALRPFLVDPPAQEPPPDAWLRASRPWGLAVNLEVELNGATICRTDLRHLYWTFAQQLAHLTSNGATTRPGDLFATGTVSGPVSGEFGSLIELTERGRTPVRLADGSTRTFLEDGDTVVLRGWCGEGDERVGFGEAGGTVVPA